MADSVRLVNYRRPRDRNLDLTPLLDVIFQLLIFFMVSSQFVSPKSKLELPLGSAGAGPEDAVSIRVEMTGGGELRVEGEMVADVDFEEHIRAAMSARGIDRVQFHGDRTMGYGDFVGLMERAQEVGVTGFDLVKTPRREGEQP